MERQESMDKRQRLPPITWQDIATRDPFLAGAIAARGHVWWDEVTAEQEADSIQLVGDARLKFLEGWKFELSEQERERQVARQAEYDALMRLDDGIDPAARTRWTTDSLSQKHHQHKRE